MRDLGSVPRDGRIKCCPPRRSANPRLRRPETSQEGDPGDGQSTRWQGPGEREFPLSKAGGKARPGPRNRRGGAFPRNGLDLWYKPFIRLFPRWSRLGAHGPDLLDPAQRFPQLSQPGVLMLPDQPDAPGQSITAAAGPPRVHEEVEHPALSLAEPGHHPY